MGALVSCMDSLLRPKSDEPTNRTPLMSAAQPRPVRTTQPQSTENSDNKSARVHNHYSPDKEQEFLRSVDELGLLQVQTIPIASMDKAFKDHVKLYNDLLSNRLALKAAIHNFKEVFASETAGVPTMNDCVRLLASKCKNATLDVNRRQQNCIQIEYDRIDVSRHVTSGSPEDILSALELFNRANRLARDILERGPVVSSSVQMVIADKHALETDILKADLGASLEPEALKACAYNVLRLRTVARATESIQRDTKRIFNEILIASKVLFEDKRMAT